MERQRKGGAQDSLVPGYPQGECISRHGSLAHRENTFIAQVRPQPAAPFRSASRAALAQHRQKSTHCATFFGRQKNADQEHSRLGTAVPSGGSVASGRREGLAYCCHCRLPRTGAAAHHTPLPTTLSSVPNAAARGSDGEREGGGRIDAGVQEPLCPPRGGVSGAGGVGRASP